MFERGTLFLIKITALISFSSIWVYDMCLPFFTDEEQKKIRSMMATINSREDFIDLLNKLADIAKHGEIKLPYFIPL